MPRYGIRSRGGYTGPRASEVRNIDANGEITVTPGPSEGRAWGAIRQAQIERRKMSRRRKARFNPEATVELTPSSERTDPDADTIKSRRRPPGV